jgi:hypothetical protein
MTVKNLLSPERHPGIEVSVETGLAQPILAQYWAAGVNLPQSD